MKTHSSPLRILAIGAHPDDLEFGMGGVLLNEQARGGELSLVITSKGEAASHGTSAEREVEALAAAAQLGARDRLTFLDFGGDGQQTASPENALALARVIRRVQPAIVFAPTPCGNQHPDHAAVGAAARDACRLARYAGLDGMRDLAAHAVGSLWFYAVTPTAGGDFSGAVLIDVSEVVETWKTLMACHQTQVSKRHYVELQLARARQLGLLAGCDYATALWPNDPPVLDQMQPVARAARAF